MSDYVKPALVTAAWDEETKVWFAASEDIPGLFVQADTFEELVKLVPELAADLLSDGEWPEPQQKPLPLEILARHYSLAYPQQ